MGRKRYEIDNCEPQKEAVREGKIEFHKIGTHRRVPFKSALAYKRQIDTERKAVLAELAAYDQELGI